MSEHERYCLPARLPLYTKNNPNIMLYKTSYFTSINLTNTLIKPRFPKLFGSSDINGDSYRKSIITIFNKKA